ncbi:hypothetical protein PRZ48_008946 [Zasmidium cellare]|uniref:Uncharacterized protein n=1 Tax=Zasmidium cellare TaxID=395010 RepID=A0ABR0EHP6_ZASCE|nr:hypothetical protein PRZ48_008946 [Zasmidium cellare]
MHFKQITMVLAALAFGAALANPIPDADVDLVVRDDQTQQNTQAQQAGQAHQGDQAHQAAQAPNTKQGDQAHQDGQYYPYNPNRYCNPNNQYGGCYRPYNPYNPNRYCNPNDPYGGCYRPYNPYPPQPRPRPGPTGTDVYGQPCGIGQICSNCNGIGGICYSVGEKIMDVGPQPGCSCY